MKTNFKVINLILITSFFALSACSETEVKNLDTNTKSEVKEVSQNIENKEVKLSLKDELDILTKNKCELYNYEKIDDKSANKLDQYEINYICGNKNEFVQIHNEIVPETAVRYNIAVAALSKGDKKYNDAIAYISNNIKIDENCVLEKKFSNELKDNTRKLFDLWINCKKS